MTTARFDRIRGDKAHPASKGYTCEKALRLDYYQNGRGERLLSPLRRCPTGRYEEIDWDTAIREVAAKLAAVRDTYGGEAIVSYGGGGQGNHLCGVYGSATLAALGLALQGQRDLAGEDRRDAGHGQDVRGAAARRLRALRGGLLHRQEPVDLPRHPARPHDAEGDRSRPRPGDDRDRSPGSPRPQRWPTTTCASDPGETPGWSRRWRPCSSTRASSIEPGWRTTPSTTTDALAALGEVPISRFCEIAGVDEALVRSATRRIAAASSVAVFEDLGVQMNRHSTLVSYLEKLVWLLTGNLAIPGGQYAMTGLGGILRMARNELHPDELPGVAGARLAGDRWSDPVQHPRRRDPRRPPEALPGDVRRVGQPGALGGRQPADARGDARPRRQRVHRRVHDRDGPGVRLRAAGHHAVREVRGDVLQLRVPTELLPSAPTGARSTGRARSPEPEIHARLVAALGMLDEGVVD